MEGAAAAKRRAQNAKAQALQRVQHLRALVSKRKVNVQYLQKVYEGGEAWLGCTVLSVQDLRQYCSAVPKQRTMSFLYLALSLGKLLHASPHISPGLPLVRALSQLVEEWEYYFANAAVQSVKFMTARTSACLYPQYSPRVTDLQASLDSSTHHSSPQQADEGASPATKVSIGKATPQVYKFNGQIVFEHLLAPHVAFELDYVEVFGALCVVLSSTYDAFLMSQDCSSLAHVYEAVLRLDARFKHHVLSIVAKELTAFCQEANALAFEMLTTESVPSWR
jgi:hypothetical protein